MELRLLTTDAERRAFTDRLVGARATHGAGFTETPQSLVGEVHLTFGRLYALFDENGPAPNEMLAGFVMHNLATFSQSYPKPDLSHLPPNEVFEIGELWAVVAGAARAVRHGCAILTGLLQARAVLVYPIFKPWNLTGAYKEFTAVGEPIQWPYIQTLEGGKILVQAMLLEGAALNQRVRDAWAMGFRTYDHHQRLLFDNPFPIARRASERVRGNAAELAHLQIPMPPGVGYSNGDGKSLPAEGVSG
jgi:hypothetical protein